jgi:hypothetical protein
MNKRDRKDNDMKAPLCIWEQKLACGWTVYGLPTKQEDQGKGRQNIKLMGC